MKEQSLAEEKVTVLNKISKMVSSIIDWTWKQFASVKLAVVLIAFIGLTSIVGTVIEQRAEPERNIQLLTKIVGEELAPTAYKIFYSLGFVDMYDSWWFRFLLLLISANLVICSLDRLPRINKIASEPVKPLHPDSFGRFSIKKEFTLKGNLDNVKGQIHGILKKLGFNPEEENTEGGGIQFFAQKGGFTRYGVYGTHLSVIIILLGAVIGRHFGFSGFLNLPEGAVSDIAYSRNGYEHPLGFSIRCDDFSIQFYGTSDMPKEYMSWLTVMENGKEVLKKAIEVNTPLRYKGYTFYQSSYGPVPESRGVLVFRVVPSNGKPKEIGLRAGESFQIPNTKITGTVLDFTPALSFDQSGKPFTYTEMMNNPAVFIEFKENGKEKYSGWVVKRYPQTWTLPDGHRVELIDNWGTQYTGLQVRKDPGVWIVYLGCTIISFALYGVFFLSHKKIWVLLTREKGKINVKLAASSNRNRISYERKIDKVLGKSYAL